MIRERQREGIALAKARGVYKGRKPALTPAQIEELNERLKTCRNKAQLARDFGIHRDTLYKYVRKGGSDNMQSA
jgi:DNA invertase Pin-like site-specific DNA recombinase